MSAKDDIKSINVDQWFETTAASPLSLETHLPEMVQSVRDVKEDRVNETHPLGCKANSVAPNSNKEINNNLSMLAEYEDAALNSDIYKHDELFESFNGDPDVKDLAPITLLCCDTIQGHVMERPLVVLLDGGSSGSLINKRSIPRGAVASRSAKAHMTTTASGNFDSSLLVGVRNIRLPEFSNGRKID